jgi:toxin ParE1/3/4
MTFFLSIEAEVDLLETGSYLSQYSQEASDKFLEEIMETCELLAAQPGMGRKRDDLRLGLRSFGVKDYLVFYRVSGDELEVVRVVSGRRDLEALFSES